MTQAHSSTLPLFDDHAAPHTVVTLATSSVLLALNVGHREWLSLLAEEWWPIRQGNTVLHLGVGKALVSEDASADIVAWIDTQQLPDIPILVLRANQWVNIKLSTIRPDDCQLVWPGPIPLFAVQRFSVGSEQRKAHVLAMADGFANMAHLEQPVCVEHVLDQAFAAAPEVKQTLCPPPLWNAFRGAAAMAAWSVPKISPWLNLLVRMFNKPDRPSRIKKLPDTDTPWMIETPWRFLTTSPVQHNKLRSVLLWRAMLSVFAGVKIRESWRPHEVLEQVCDEARRLGVIASTLDDLLLETIAVLDNRKMLDAQRGAEDPAGLVLQLVLLRPKPEQFITWRQDIPLLPPGVLWSGAILSGLLTGYRNLETRFREDRTLRTLLDLKILALTSKKKLPWPQCSEEPISVKIVGQSAQINVGDTCWSQKKLGRRGLWYQADFAQTAIQDQAHRIAEFHCPHALTQVVLLRKGTSPLQGAGRLQVRPSTSRAPRKIAVSGEVKIPLSDHVRIVTQLNVEAFRKWITTAALEAAIPGPTKIQDADQQRGEIVGQDSEVSGFQLIRDFITEEHERALIQEVDNSVWSNELKRRVQHYGWRYDYKARDVRASTYLGPLPDWAQQLARRLHQDKLMPELADQVIVNEYVQAQGISKHIDCVDCFRGPVVTISLLASWEMIFRKGPEKLAYVLEQRSAAVLDGPARMDWTHEIPPRKSEQGQPRARRISLTFRKMHIID